VGRASFLHLLTQTNSATRLIAIILSVAVAVFGAALAFYKMNERPFIRVVEDFFHYSLSSKLYIWKKEENKR